MVGSWRDMNQGSRAGKGTAFMAGRRPEEPCPAGDRASIVASAKAALFCVRKEPLVWRRAPWHLAAGKGGSAVMTAFVAGVKNPNSSMVPVGAADE